MPRTGFHIVEEGPEHFAPASRLLRDAFAGEAEARLVDDLRREGHRICALAAEDEGGDLIGHVVFSRLGCDMAGVNIAAVALAPLAVAEGVRRKGIGAALVKEGLRRCRERGFALAFVLGNENFYGRFGFSRQKARGIICPYSGPHLLVAELASGALGCGEGKLTYAPPFERLT